MEPRQRATYLFTIFLLVLQYSRDGWCSQDNNVKAACSPEAEVCSFTLHQSYSYSMMHYTNGELGHMLPLVAEEDGLYAKRRDCSGTDKLSPQESSKVVTGDGSYKLIVTYNGTVPGPPIVVYAGQTIEIKLTNMMEGDSTTLHFHGLPQWGTPWMDGAGGVSHCPINPGETFTYRFKATPVGTFWYHSHYGYQRTMGAYGALIILDPDVQATNARRVLDPLPVFDGDFYLTAHDWMRKIDDEVMINAQFAMVSYAKSYYTDQCFTSTVQVDKADCGVEPFISGVINGKGRFYNKVTDEVENPFVPLEVFKVKKGGKFRFRAICASMTYAFRISVDNHTLHIISTDGHDVVTKQVESVIVFTGERYDFYIEADDPEGVGNYWMRAETLERYNDTERIRPSHVEAIVRYEGAEEVEPTTSRRDCTPDDPCVTLNCPFEAYPDEDNIVCAPVTSLRYPAPIPAHGLDSDQPIEEIFLNFHFAGFDSLNGSSKPSINGRQYVAPVYPPQVFPENPPGSITECDADICDADWCECTNMIDLELNKVVQLTIYNTAPGGGRLGQPHPVHLHGHALQILKMGFPSYDPDTKAYVKDNADFTCTLNTNCNTATWSDPTWLLGNVPDIINQSPPLKDTVVLPVGGYIVVRFKSSNPGYWLMHCHTEFHSADGMMLIVKEGDVSEMPTPPDGMRRCGNWSPRSAITQSEISIASPEADTIRDLESSIKSYQIAVVLSIMVAIVCLSILIVGILILRPRRKNGYEQIPTTLSLE